MAARTPTSNIAFYCDLVIEKGYDADESLAYANAHGDDLDFTKRAFTFDKLFLGHEKIPPLDLPIRVMAHLNCPSLAPAEAMSSIRHIQSRTAELMRTRKHLDRDEAHRIARAEWLLDYFRQVRE